ncbi:UDP-glucose dehydrogenase family protein [Amycolatopsis pithecellobii]|uniref:UDP-glucose 6-dehydrogenase n=1 Tax=Amycolatopsis pithecellobii TaxID=664692 RepID=A0A6N7YX02_9PSEU|nr:UDP-glucose/GDP-mannose dehydrogenase family protein [Amycolatopsis pithecellobii]MTD53393.1 nucleotide sugar dehydrogenase [Amycolatopsis pithecellobii]
MGNRVGVVGAGYVGLTTAACLAHLGHHVTCADNDQSKVEECAGGEIPIAEPGLRGLVRDGLAEERLAFTTDLAALDQSDVVLLCLPTPTGPDGTADLSVVETVLGSLREVLPPGCVLVTKSTVPVGTAARLPRLLGRDDIPVVSNPEFLSEGTAVADFLEPDRVVIGSAPEHREAADRVAGLYAGLDAPVIRTSAKSAELAKYASNAFLAVKLSYVNTLAELCEHLGAEIGEVTMTMGLDERIGPDFLAAGPGWGGSCLPKDTSALLGIAEGAGVDLPLVRDAVAVNARQAAAMLRKIRIAATGTPDGSLSGARIGLLGLAFKAGTGDLRDSPALGIAAELAAQGAELTAHDPQVPDGPGWLTSTGNPYQVANRADAVVVLTEWPQFRELDWFRMAAAARRPVVVDTRNLLDDKILAGTGMRRIGVGAAKGEEAGRMFCSSPPSTRSTEPVTYCAVRYQSDGSYGGNGCLQADRLGTVSAYFRPDW